MSTSNPFYAGFDFEKLVQDAQYCENLLKVNSDRTASISQDILRPSELTAPERNDIVEQILNDHQKHKHEFARPGIIELEASQLTNEVPTNEEHLLKRDVAESISQADDPPSFFSGPLPISDGAVMVEKEVMEEVQDGRFGACALETFGRRNGQAEQPSGPWASSGGGKKPGRRSRELLVARVKAKEMQECTFQPKTNPNRHIKSKSWNGFIKRQENWDRRRKDSLLEKKMANTVQNEPEEDQAYYAILRRKQMLSEEAVEDRLLQQGQERQERTKALAEKVVRDKLAECTFAPRIAPKSRKKAEKNNHRPIWNRLGELQRKKREKKMALAQKAKMETSFEPKICKQSKKMVRGSSTFRISDPALRLADTRIHEIREIQRNTKRRQLEEDACTFRPKVNPVSIKIADEINRSRDTGSFIERQELYKEIARENHMAAVCKKIENEMATFTPDIGNADKVLVKSSLRIRYESEDDDARANRLSVGDSQKKQNLQEILKEEYYGRYTFKPKINKVSKKIGRDSSFQVLSSVEVHRRKIDEVMLDRERKFRLECPFQPLINENSRNIRSSGYHEECPINLLQDIDAYEAEKQERLQKAKEAQEEEMMKECSFKPKINKHRVKPKRKIFIAGLDKFNERIKHGNKLKEEKEQRKKAAFSVSDRILKNRTKGCTTAKPFNLRSSKTSLNKKRLERKQRAQQDVQLAELETSFHPKTVHRANRELVKCIIYAENDA